MDYQMDTRQAINIVYARLRKLQPDCVCRALGAILVCLSENEIVDLAQAPDTAILNYIDQCTPLVAKPSDPSISSSSTSSWEHPQLPVYPNPMLDMQLQNQNALRSLEVEYESFYSGGGSSSVNNLNLNSLNGSRMSNQGVSSPRDKTCHYFNKGHCRHGNDCRYNHGLSIEDSFSRMYVTEPNEFVNDEHMFSPRSLEQLELEIKEILKDRRGNPVSIASLPMIYLEKYGKILQADGYLTESQRHGKAGYSLTKLLARFKNSLRLIDRPHGQHAIVLAEDAPKYMDYRMERNDPGPIVNGSRQLYMTFPAESTFTEHDVASYFSSYGMVEDVRIPLQAKRMFGFVTFTSADTVMHILAKGNPHYVCRARVLVKPYREKPKSPSDRSYGEKVDSAMYGAGLYADTEPDLYPIHAELDTSMMLRHFLEEQEQQASSASRRHYVGLELARQLPPIHPFPKPDLVQSTVNTNEFRYIEDFLSTDEPTNTNCDSNTSAYNLPQSPFASPIKRSTYSGM